MAAGVIPRSGGADLWKHRAFNREAAAAAAVAAAAAGLGGETRNAKKERKFKKKIKKNHGTWGRGRGRGRGRAGLRDPEKCGDKGDEARRCALERDEQRLDSRGGSRELVEEVCDGAFTEEKPSCSLVEKSNLVTERLTDRLGRGKRVRRARRIVASGNAIRARKRDRASLHRSTIELRVGGPTVTLI